ncbi:MAG: response regulator transcription factor [Candidatus Scalindua sp.]|jgi:DNA-binding NarL/FixJ family response regulator|nr:response regulator transcription factor [Candidatus Scalindua sp.]MBT5305945.1 response regulator transcription factor [Candidatus Scalindua sp.]MBT6052012.1 response regulator transcription factor [Candidatus Scalindua sp.]MBT6226680.1 response regulator transcription factor [Candidatus Scalindua sp.]MBT6561255.1 response regulator transcription factor [Candidatus Scalindua sp.]
MNNNKKPLRITISCCNHLFGEGLKKLLREECNLRADSIITVSTNPREITKEKNDLLITDFNTLAGIIFDDISEKHKVRILLLGTGCLPKIENECLISFISRGLAGILSPETDLPLLKKAIECILSGELWFENKQLLEIIPGIKGKSCSKGPSLTNREIEVVKLICNGSSNKEIKKTLNISEQAVKSHLSRIYKKTGVSDRLQLALYAINSSVFVMDQRCRRDLRSK